MHIQPHSHLRLAGTDVTVGVGRIQRTGHQELLSWVWLLIQKNLQEKKHKQAELPFLYINVKIFSFFPLFFLT